MEQHLRAVDVVQVSQLPHRAAQPRTVNTKSGAGLLFVRWLRRRESNAHLRAYEARVFPLHHRAMSNLPAQANAMFRQACHPRHTERQT